MTSVVLLLLAVLIPLIAQWNITSTFSKFRAVNNGKNKCGQEVARAILDANGLNDVHVVEVKGSLSDHYDPKQKVVRLSTEVFHGESVAAMAVAAHECGHAIQDKEGYSWMKIRSAMWDRLLIWQIDLNSTLNVELVPKPPLAINYIQQ